MPRLSDIVSGWQNANEIAPEENNEDTIALHRRKVLRTRAAAAGPHPYLDRFASGMHRPLEGECTINSGRLITLHVIKSKEVLMPVSDRTDRRTDVQRTDAIGIFVADTEGFHVD